MVSPIQNIPVDQTAGSVTTNIDLGGADQGDVAHFENAMAGDGASTLDPLPSAQSNPQTWFSRAVDGTVALSEQYQGTIAEVTATVGESMSPAALLKASLKMNHASTEVHVITTAAHKVTSTFETLIKGGGG